MTLISGMWLHTKCIGVTDDDYLRLQHSDEAWCCKTYLKEALPFFDTSNLSIPDTSVLSPTTSTSSLHGVTDGNSSQPTSVAPHSLSLHSLNLFYSNCRSLPPKIDSLRALAAADDPDIILLCETWLDDSITDAELSISNYSICRRDRNRHGGGVAIYVRDNVPYSVFISHTSLELLMVDLKLKQGNLLCGVFYRPPSSAPSILTLLDSTLEELPPNKQKSLVLLGDFNIDSRNQNLPSLSLINSIQDKFGLQQVVTEPTRTSSTSETIIDHAYLADKAMLSSCETEPPLEDSDHRSISLKLHLLPPRGKRVRRKVWIYKQADFDTANDTLQCLPSDIYLDNSNDIDSFWIKWRDFFLATMSSCIPCKNISSTKRLPYLNKDLTLLIRKKQRRFKQAKRLNSERAWAKYNKARNQVTSALRSAKATFFSNLSSSVKSSKDFWAVFNRLTPNRQRIPDNLTHNAHSAKSSQDKADLLNRFFASCFTSPASSTTGSPPITSSSAPNTSLSSFTCSQDDVFHLLSTCKIKTASGPDGISSAMLRGTAESISPSLTTLFNLSLEQGVVPTDWKISNVTPIHKCGEKSLAKNYRPISLLSLVSKALERLVHTKLLNYILSNNLLSERQHGFRPGSSTQEALLLATNDWQYMLSSNKQVAAVFLDIRKAFDSVPHHHLITSLSKLGVSGPLLKWFKSYLSDRQQRVVLDGETSASCSVTSGVPQGSILGPLLFIIFMNSLTGLPLSPNTKLLLYADDILLYKPINSQEDSSAFQQDVDSINNWMNEHNLTLNTSKSHLMQITRSRNPSHISIALDGTPLEIVRSTKYLGVTISSDLNWRDHITSTRKKSQTTPGPNPPEISSSQL